MTFVEVFDPPLLLVFLNLLVLVQFYAVSLPAVLVISFHVQPETFSPLAQFDVHCQLPPPECVPV